ncbi:chemotaxis protein CheB [Micromonospora sp. CPCC 205371]|nr:chemotaxis protein CheB [Micromonospora sp. CPCC 205371]
MANVDVVVIGASAGGVEALQSVMSRLPSDLPAAVLVVLHVPRSAPSALPRILDRAGPLPARAAVDGEPLRMGHVHVAIPDHHLLIIGGRIRLSRGPAENGHRPAIDPLFRSAARVYGPRAVGVILSGARDDGAAGLLSIARTGGTVVIQDPADALHPSMPLAALERVSSDHVVPAAKIGDLLAELAGTGVEYAAPSDPRRLDAEVAMADSAPLTAEDLDATPGGYGCPQCGGALFEIEEASVPRYRCRIGHAWSPDSLLEEQAIATESALWMALRALEEKSSLGRRMAAGGADRYRVVAEDAEHAARLIRDLIARFGGDPGGAPTGAG